MISIKPDNWKIGEFIGLGIIYLILVLNAIFFKDSLVAVFSAFFGVTYTMLAGKGTPKCYLYGLAGSGLYVWLAFSNAIWGNLFLYLFYYIPMQIVGFFKWNTNLKKDTNEIIKIKLQKKELYLLVPITIFLSFICILILNIAHDKSPIIDGIATICSITGMYLTVKRAIEQWIIWMIVNGITAIMWINIALNGEKVYSTVVMWVVYFILAIYFYREWKKEVV